MEEGERERWSEAGFKGQGRLWRMVIGRLVGRHVCVRFLFFFLSFKIPPPPASSFAL